MIICNLSMKGFYRMQLRNKFSGKCRIDTGWFPNIILDAGRNLGMPVVANWLTHCQVGTDGTLPSVLDTSLGGHVASTSNILNTDFGNSSNEPYYGWKRKLWRFPAGSVTGILAEVAVGWGAGADTLISRALIIDPVTGTSTTIAPLVDEILDVSYELRYYPSLVDTFSVVELYGTTYNTETRAASVTGSNWSSYIGQKFGKQSSYNSDWKAYSGDIGEITEAPSGVSVDCDNSAQSTAAYSNNSYQIKVNTFVGPTGWNVVGGIRSIRWRTTMGDYQTQFNAVSGGNTIPKTALLTMQMAWTVGWDNL